MKKRNLSLLKNQVYNMFKQNTSIAFAEKIRMCANGAYFAVIKYMQALTRHCSKSAVFKYSKVISEFNGAHIEWARTRECRKLHHLIRMLRLKSNRNTF